MDDAIKSKIANAFGKLPDSCRFPKARESELSHFEAEFGPIPIDYRWFLSKCGGGPVGSEWVDGIAQLAETHRKYRRECAIQNGWTMSGVFVIGWNGAGNPYGIHTSTGNVVVEDHEFGGIHELAESFEAFLVSGLLSKAPVNDDDMS